MPRLTPRRDRKRREEAETRNQAESLVSQTQKFLADSDDKVPADVKSKVEGAVEEARRHSRGNDTATIKTAIENRPRCRRSSARRSTPPARRSPRLRR